MNAGGYISTSVMPFDARCLYSMSKLQVLERIVGQIFAVSVGIRFLKQATCPEGVSTGKMVTVVEQQPDMFS
jgi:hypothetical protein